MPIYQYKGISTNGKTFKDKVNADSLAQAKSKLVSNGVMLLDIKEMSSNKNSAFGLKFGKKVNIAELSLMTRQLATLLKAKIPLSDSLKALVDQLDSDVLPEILEDVRKKINEGISLADALKDYPDIFNNVYINMVQAGEASGTLDIVLIRLAEFTESQVKLKNKITSSMMYPTIMALVGTGMMLFIFVVIVPKITKIFITMKKEIPLPTQICIDISHFLQNYWQLIPIIVPLFLYGFFKYINSPTGKWKWHAFQLKLPLVGNLVTMINVGRFCSTLATLLNSGVPILASLRIVKNLIGNIHMQDAVEHARESVQEGASIAKPLKDSGLFPAMVTHMIDLGEKSGEIESMLDIIAENYEDQVNSKLEGLTSILEPIMMIVMGGVVAFVVISVVVPLMSLNTMSR